MQARDSLLQTRSLVKGVMERAQLLLNVTIAQNDYSTTTEKKGVHVSVLL